MTNDQMSSMGHEVADDEMKMTTWAGRPAGPGGAGRVAVRNAACYVLAAGSILVALPALIIFPAVQKQFIPGLTLGATRG